MNFNRLRNRFTFKKKFFANTPEMKKLSQQAKSRIFTETNNYASSSIAEVEFFPTAYMLWFYFILGLNFFPSFWFMLMYDNKFKTKENTI